MIEWVTERVTLRNAKHPEIKKIFVSSSNSLGPELVLPEAGIPVQDNDRRRQQHARPKVRANILMLEFISYFCFRGKDSKFLIYVFIITNRILEYGNLYLYVWLSYLIVFSSFGCNWLNFPMEFYGRTHPFLLWCVHLLSPSLPLLPLHNICCMLKKIWIFFPPW